MKRFRVETGQSKHNTFARPLSDDVASVVLSANVPQYISIPSEIGVSSIGDANTPPKDGRTGIALFSADKNFWMLKNGVSGSNPIAIPPETSTAGAHPIQNPAAIAIEKDVSSLGLLSSEDTYISIEYFIAV